MDTTVYTPQTISDVPFPQTDLQQQATTQPSANDIIHPATIQESPFPTPKVALELLSAALNTRSKKVVQSFDFAQSGALQIGQLIPGVSGDVRISPAGIVARDQSGNNTFALDGDTGDAVFAGNLQSGTQVTGQIVMGADGAIFIGDPQTGQTIMDSQGIVSTTSFPVNSLHESTSQSFTNTTMQDVANQSSLSLTLLRQTRAIVFLSVNGSSEQVNGASDCSGRTTYQVTSSIDGNIASLFYDSSLSVTSGARENIVSKPYTVLKGVTLSKGTHTITLQAQIGSVVNFRSVMNNFNISIILLGK